MFRRTALAAALVAAIVSAPLAAQAAPSSSNVLRGFCAANVKTSCVSVMDNDEGDLRVIDKHGDTIGFGSSRAALTWLRHHGATACKTESSARCYWDAKRSGNGRGDSYIVVGGRSLFYLGNLD